MSQFDPSIFRAYDMRGTYPNQMNAEVAYTVGQAFVKVMGAKNVVVGRDVRVTGPELQKAMLEGIMDAGANAIDIGIISTEMLYFAATYLDCDGGMSITASHNPADWNGIKFIGPDAKALTKDAELGQIYEAAKTQAAISASVKGTLSQTDLLEPYTEFLNKFLPAKLPKIKIVANTNFGANGKIVDKVTKHLPALEIVRLNWQEDGHFPKGTPDPLLPKNREEISQLVVKEEADFGVAWDADADRIFFYDDKGRFFHGCYITALLISHFLSSEPGQAIVIERRLTWANLDAIQKGHGKTVLSRTGHGFIKAVMRENQAIFGGESSGHFYYRDFNYCDNGMISFLAVLQAFAKLIEQGQKVSDLLDEYLEKFPITLEELNYITPDAANVIASATQKFADAEINEVDGLSAEYPDWRFNLRSSSNEPVLRLNVEARSTNLLKQKIEEMKGFVESFGATLRDDHA